MGLGPGRQHSIQVVQAEHPRRRGPRPPDRALARADRRRRLLRDQFHHVNDIAPTIYDVLGITAPDIFRGLEQLPISGKSMRYTFDDPDVPTDQRIQYYEMFGHRAIVADGWKAVTRHQAGTPFDDESWELYHYEVDRSECHDLATSMPGKLEELISLWWEEAEDQGVLPLDDRSLELFFTRYRDRSVHPTRPSLYLLSADGAPTGSGGALVGGGDSTWPPPSTGRWGQVACSSPPAPRTRESACSSRVTGW